MKTSKKGLKFITQWEGTFLEAYRDVAGVLTIGVGHTSAAGSPTVYEGQTITQTQSDQILASDLKKVEDNVNRLVKVKLTQNQYDVLVSFDFNTGALAKSSALRYLNEGNYEQAAINLTLYNKARVNGQLKVVQGLVNRRTAEKKLFLTPDSTAVSDVTKAGAGAVVVGAGTVATAPTNYVPYIIAGLIISFVAYTFYTTIRDYRRNKNVPVSK